MVEGEVDNQVGWLDNTGEEGEAGETWGGRSG